MIWRRSFTLGGTLWRTVRGRSGAVVVQDQRCRRKEIQIETGWVRTLAKSFASPPPELMMGRLDWDSCVCVYTPPILFYRPTGFDSWRPGRRRYCHTPRLPPTRLLGTSQIIIHELRSMRLLVDEFATIETVLKLCRSNRRDIRINRDLLTTELAKPTAQRRSATLRSLHLDYHLQKSSIE